MKRTIVLFAIALAFVCRSHAAEAANTLTAAEKAAGWQLLFDGTTSSGWHSPKKDTFPTQGWKIEDGMLHKLPGVRGGDLVSAKAYSEFDFVWEWKLAPKGNSGIKYFNTPERGSIGHEYQMLDDATQGEGKDNGKFSTASFYHVLAPLPAKVAALKPAGEWNISRVFVKGDKVEHYLNGQKVLEYTLGSPEVKEAVQKSKFKDVAKFGERVKGHILLTDHNDETFFRNIKILDLSKD